MTGTAAALGQVDWISTHTPLAGRDNLMYYIRKAFPISTHTPLAGRDIFCSDLSDPRQISTHTPLAGRDETVCQYTGLKDISTHTPLAGRDWFNRKRYGGTPGFLLTRPLRDVTYTAEQL